MVSAPTHHCMGATSLQALAGNRQRILHKTQSTTLMETFTLFARLLFSTRDTAAVQSELNVSVCAMKWAFSSCKPDLHFCFCTLLTETPDLLGLRDQNIYFLLSSSPSQKEKG